MLNNVSKKINKKMALEESVNDFRDALQPDEPLCYFEESLENQNFNGNGDEMTMFEANNFFMEDTEYDPDLTTSLQDETDADDDVNFDNEHDLEADTDLFREVDYNDDFSQDYINDTDPSSCLDKEVDYNDTYNKDADISDYVEESFDFLLEEEIMGDGQLTGDEVETDDVDIDVDTDETNVPMSEDFFMEEDEMEDLEESGETDLEEDFFMEEGDMDLEGEEVSEDFFMEEDEMEDLEECGETDLEEDFFMEEDEMDEDMMSEDFFMENGSDATIPTVDEDDDLDDINFEDGQSTDTIYADDPDDLDIFVDDEE